MKFKKDHIIFITTGAYDDYMVMCHVRVLRDFDAFDEISRFVKTGDYLVDRIIEAETDQGSDERFIEWLCREGIAEKISDELVSDLHIGEYCSLLVDKTDYPELEEVECNVKTVTKDMLQSWDESGDKAVKVEDTWLFP